ncbi:hypothetical protein [Paenibacillus agricola]|uniref:Uncharacterized protein n=1 Tax=Paenibacillus agricola TaxID=2716264 RepID=A0ABX0J6X7_9BACL|nr:hypothetical protein [Paenibacillus agricola]NHN31165.1 hypothetical protein [Paenibacillus agricola]
MRVIETHAIGTDYEYEGKGSITVTVEDGAGNRRSADISAGEPEDAVFFRDLNGAYSIADLVKIAYEAGKRGESYEYEFIDENAEEDEEEAV